MHENHAGRTQQTCAPVQFITATRLRRINCCAPVQDLLGSARKAQDLVEEGRDPLDVLGGSVWDSGCKGLFWAYNGT